jgi:hypothetical protein
MEMLVAERNRVEHAPKRLLQAIDGHIDNLREELTGLTTPSTALSAFHPALGETRFSCKKVVLVCRWGIRFDDTLAFDFTPNPSLLAKSSSGCCCGLRQMSRADYWQVNLKRVTASGLVGPAARATTRWHRRIGWSFPRTRGRRQRASEQLSQLPVGLAEWGLSACASGRCATVGLHSRR